MAAAAEASADRLIRSEGRQVLLEESLHLGLPFLLPDGGFSCDTVRGIPSGLLEFLEPVCQRGERKQDSVSSDLLAEGAQLEQNTSGGSPESSALSRVA